MPYERVYVPDERERRVIESFLCRERFHHLRPYFASLEDTDLRYVNAALFVQVASSGDKILVHVLVERMREEFIRRETQAAYSAQ